MSPIPEKMKALWLEDGRLCLRSNVSVPRPGSNQALVRVHLAGICATDRHLIKGYYPYTGIPGHEFVGTVIEAPDDRTQIGRRVVGNINISCGVCERCRSGKAGHCADRSVLGIQGWSGAMAPFVCLPLENLVTVPDHVPDKAAVFAEPLAAALQIQRQVRIGAADDILIVGAGSLGQLVARTIALTGGQLEVVARYTSQRGKLEAAGIGWLTEKDVPQERYNLVVEASGSPQGFALAQKALQPTGTLVLKSTFKGQVPVTLSELVVNEVMLIGSRCGPMDQAVAMLAEQRIDPLSLIEGLYTIDQAQEAFRAAAQPGKLKVLVQL
jgi:2-desacetyl-2-hydroxyethyl bacteriochlorophyllide A dehydrogenase